MSSALKVPQNVRKSAKLGLKLLNAGFEGGTQTGWDRAHQLAYDESVPIADLATMRAWFARHGPDAANGGTSYRGYRKWIDNARPMKPQSGSAAADAYRGAVSWLIWGGDDAYRWLKSARVRKALRKAYPKRKEASRVDNLQ